MSEKYNWDQVNEAVMSLFENDENYYKPVKIRGGVFNKTHLELESNSDRYKNLSFAEYLNEICPYLKN